jgi:Gpi18-like mannosyltransferase
MLSLRSIGSRIREVFLPIVAIYLSSRLILLFIAVLSRSQIAVAPETIDHSLASYLCRFDCGWYLSVAQDGYSAIEPSPQLGATNFGFFPLFPLLIRVAAPLFAGNLLYAALAVTNLCFLTALVFVYRYARLLDLDRTAALLTVTLLCIMPQSIVFSAVYTESPFLLLLVVAMYYLRREKYLVAGIAAALLSATRANGIFFIVFNLGWIIHRDGIRSLLRPWLAPEKFVPVVLAPMGLFLFWGYCFVTTGDAFAHPSTEQHGWGLQFVPPWKNLPIMFRTGSMTSTAAVFSLAAFACSWLLLRQRLYEEFALCTALFLLAWSCTVTGSVFRYWLVLFPIWIALARTLAPRPILLATTFSILAMINGMMMCAWTLKQVFAI